MPAHPSQHEAEVSVFGPGVGEAAAIHLGNREWMLVDSCVDSRTGGVATLDYLSAIGVDVETEVQWVVATHAHDDHIEGLSEIVEACARATVILPEASNACEFLALAKIDERLTFYETRWTVYGEYRRAMSHLELRNNFDTLSWASAGEEFPLGARQRGEKVELLFLAPSDVATTRSKQVLGRLLHAATRQGAGERVARRDPNSFSSALVVHADDITVLLGGDVLVGAASWGWQHIVATFPFVDEISAHKVAHHGAPNGHHDTVWSTWPTADCVSIVTPYRPSGRPRAADVARMKGYGGPVWQTASSQKIPKSRQAKRTAAKTRQVTLGGVAEVGGQMGHVRVRWRNHTSVVERFGPAFRL